MLGRKIAEYSLRVLDDGREVFFRDIAETICPPGFSSFEGIRYLNNGYLHVHRLEVLELPNGEIVEEIEVRSIKINCGERFIAPHPHGAGWRVHNDKSDNYTIYRRHAPAERRIFSDVGAWLRARAEDEGV
jgi:hypothetical protein